jgi:hypothetical protein
MSMVDTLERGSKMFVDLRNHTWNCMLVTKFSLEDKWS